MRRKLIIKSVLFLFVLGAFAALSRNSVTKKVPHTQEIKIEYKSQASKKISGSDQNKSVQIKRYKKPKGVVAIQPQIDTPDFIRFCTIKGFDIPKTESKNTCFLYCIQLKRGPPAV